MDHLRRDLHAGFGGNEDDAPKTLGAHAWPVVPCKAHARQHIGLKQALPIFVGNGKGILDFENTDVVDQDVDLAATARRRR
jgi:hypothetical protein